MTPRRWLLACAACAAAGIALGLYLRRAPEVREVERVHLVEVAMAHEEWVTRREVETTTAMTRRTVRETTTLPTGARHEREEIVEHTGTQARETTEASGSRVEVRTVELERVVERRVETMPDWRAAALVGWDGGLVYGAAVERRIVGPLAVGVWGHTGGAVGIVGSYAW